jgi:ATP-dependent RNA helicase HrpB
LLGEPWLGTGKIVMLEPRRLAARAAAHRMAHTLDERVGATIGYRVRLDTRVGPATRIEVVTEGILTRLIQSDPALEGIGLIIFDEFHERSLHADLGLALTLQSREVLREELRILVMSATLDGERVAALLGGAPVVTSEGRSFPVETRYVAPRAGSGPAHIEPRVAATIRQALAADDGDVLAFLPGAGEIRRVESLLAAEPLPNGTYVAPLHGTLPQEAQDEAIAPSVPGRRKVVLATSIAETSLTIEGVRVVVDSGLARVPRFSPRTGMTRLETVRVSRASADQRRGRAGRVAPGVCYRLWPEHEAHHLLPHALPEIVEADLAPLALELAAAGVHDPAELRWLDPPPAAAYAQARELLVELGALTGGEAPRITAHGRQMAAFGAHPRLAHMALRGAALGAGALACELAALLGERDPLRGARTVPNADVALRLDVVRGDGAVPPGAQVDRDAVRRIRREAAAWTERLRAGARDRASQRAPAEPPSAGALLALAYPDRVGQRRPGPGGRFLLRNGQGAAFAEAQGLSESPFIVAAELDGQRPESRIFLAAPIDREEIDALFADQVVRDETIAWDAATRAVVARRQERLGAIVLEDRPLADPDPARVAEAMLDGIRREGIGVLPWREGARGIQARVAFLRRLDATWPDLGDDALGGTMDAWLVPHLYGVRRLDALDRLDLADVLLGMLGREQRRRLDELAPTHITVPSGSRLPIDYADADAPVLAVRLQEMFGLADTPRVGGGRVPLTLHLLSPAHRPVQVTRDLAGFWRTSYFDVRKDLRGRYPKHPWPDDPLRAEPTRRAKPMA